MKSYLITDPFFYTSNSKTFTKKLLLVIENTFPDFICIRDKVTNNYKDIALEVKKFFYILIIYWLMNWGFTEFIFPQIDLMI